MQRGDRLQIRVAVDGRLVLQLRGEEDIRVAGLHDGQTGRLLLDRAEDHLVEVGQPRGPVVRIPSTGDVVARHPFFPGEGSGAVRGGGDRVGSGRFRIDLDRASG